MEGAITDKVEPSKKIDYKKYHDGKVKFAFQFPVNSNSIFNVTILGNALFKKSEYNENTIMKQKPVSMKPSEHYNKILNKFTEPLLKAFIKLKTLIQELENHDDFIETERETLKKVEIYVPLAIEMCIMNINVINRVKMERMMIIIKTGINSHCDYEITEALVELETIVKIYYPEDRRYMCENESQKLKRFVIDMSIVEPKSVVKFLNTIKLDSTITHSVRDILLKLAVGDRSKLLKVIIDYLNNINKVETVINSTVSVSETFDMINKKQGEFSDGKTKTIEFATMTISMVIIDGEIYVDYFGFIDRPVGGSFSIDLYRFRNFINDNITYYVFYLVTCHYCLMNSNNILSVNFDIIPEEIKNMFIFFEAIHMNKVMESIEEIPVSLSYKKMFTHLYKFFYELMGRKRPEQRKKITTGPIQVPKSVIDEANKNGDKVIDILRDGKKVSIIIPGEKNLRTERLEVIKKRNNMRKNK